MMMGILQLLIRSCLKINALKYDTTTDTELISTDRVT